MRKHQGGSVQQRFQIVCARLQGCCLFLGGYSLANVECSITWEKSVVGDVLAQGMQVFLFVSLEWQLGFIARTFEIFVDWRNCWCITREKFKLLKASVNILT